MVGPIGPPGFNGSRGPPGQAGSRGEQGPKGAGDFSECLYKRIKDINTPGTKEADVAIAEPNVSVMIRLFLNTTFCLHASAESHVTIIGIFSLMDYSISHPTENTLKLNQSHCMPTLLSYSTGKFRPAYLMCHQPKKKILQLPCHAEGLKYSLCQARSERENALDGPRPFLHLFSRFPDFCTLPAWDMLVRVELKT